MTIGDDWTDKPDSERGLSRSRYGGAAVARQFPCRDPCRGFSSHSIVMISISPKSGQPRKSVTDFPSARRVLSWARACWLKPPAESPEGPFQTWKRSWALGANARWANTPMHANPNQPGSPGAKAWRAGWRWAEQQPDRRAIVRVRLAHPYRRWADHPSPVLQSARTAGVGVSTLVIAAWLWQIRAKRRSGASRHGRRP